MTQGNSQITSWMYSAMCPKNNMAFQEPIFRKTRNISKKLIYHFKVYLKNSSACN
jgi:hypothetical protein